MSFQNESDEKTKTIAKLQDEVKSLKQHQKGKRKEHTVKKLATTAETPGPHQQSPSSSPPPAIHLASPCRRNTSPQLEQSLDSLTASDHEDLLVASSVDRQNAAVEDTRMHSPPNQEINHEPSK